MMVGAALVFVWTLELNSLRRMLGAEKRTEECPELADLTAPR